MYSFKCTRCFISLGVLYVCFITLHVYSMLYNSVCVLYVLQLYLSREESTAVEPANISLSEYSSLSSSGGSEDEAGVEDWSKDSIRSNHHHSWDISKITMSWINFIMVIILYLSSLSTYKYGLFIPIHFKKPMCNVLWWF